MSREPEASAQLKFRVSEDLRKQLEGEARANGVSLTKEIIRRLEGSLQRHAPTAAHHQLELPRQPASRKTAAAVAALVTRQIEAFTQERWNRDRFTAEAVVEAFRLYVLALTAPGETKIPEMIAMRPKDRFTEDFSDPTKLADLVVGHLAAKIATKDKQLSSQQIENVVESGLDLPSIVEVLEDRKITEDDDS